MRRTLLVPLSLAAISLMVLTPAQGSNMGGFHAVRSYRLFPELWQDAGKGYWRRLDSLTLPAGGTTSLAARFGISSSSRHVSPDEWRNRVLIVENGSSLIATLKSNEPSETEILDIVDGMAAGPAVTEADSWLAGVDEIDGEPISGELHFDLPPLAAGDYTLVDILATGAAQADDSTGETMTLMVPVHVE